MTTTFLATRAELVIVCDVECVRYTVARELGLSGDVDESDPYLVTSLIPKSLVDLMGYAVLRDAMDTYAMKRAGL